MRATAPTAPLTFDSFLAWEERQPERFELVGGVVRLMAGGTEGHDRIGANIFAAPCGRVCVARRAPRMGRTSRW